MIRLEHIPAPLALAPDESVLALAAGPGDVLAVAIGTSTPARTSPEGDAPRVETVSTVLVLDDGIWTRRVLEPPPTYQLVLAAWSPRGFLLADRMAPSRETSMATVLLADGTEMIPCPLAAGVMGVACDPGGTLWATYWDEGIFGGSEPGMLIGTAGLEARDLATWEYLPDERGGFDVIDIADTSAPQVDREGALWFAYQSLTRPRWEICRIRPDASAVTWAVPGRGEFRVISANAPHLLTYDDTAVDAWVLGEGVLVHRARAELRQVGAITPYRGGLAAYDGTRLLRISLEGGD